MPEELQDIGKIPGFDSNPSTDPTTDAALDALFEEATGAVPNPLVSEIPPEPSEVKPKVDDEGKPKVDDEVKPKADDGVESKTDDSAVKSEEFEKIELPPHTKPKTGEAFDLVKKLAREKVTALQTELEAVKKTQADLEAKVKGGTITPEIEKELKELREFRNKLDVEADPEFKSFDVKVTENTEFIYKKLEAAGTPAATIEKIKSFGGPANIDWEPLLDKLPAITRRAIESKLVDSEDLLDKKSKAIETAKKNADEFVKGRASQTENQRKDLQARAEKTLKGWVDSSLTWMKPKTADPKATADEKAAVAAHNKLVQNAEEYMKDAIADDSPEMRATLALAGPELLLVRHEFATHKKTAEAQITKLTTDLRAANALLEKVKKGSTSSLRHSPADSGAAPTKPASKETAEEALDRMAREASNEN